MRDKTTKTDATILTMNEFPLHGTRLIEASAGTGKTYTIAGLYLRLILGHGHELIRHAEPLTVEQILVVTFTEAATAELRGRIRQRIHEARLAFARGESDDPVIQPLLRDTQDHDLAMRLLLQAEREMDSAAIYTIHGFCQRMLVQNAFESGSRFANEFVTDETRLKIQVVTDYWRRWFYPLNRALAMEIRRLWAEPSVLLEKIGRYLTGHTLQLSVQPQADIEALHQKNIEKIQVIKQMWLTHGSDLESLLEQSDIDRKTYSKRYLPLWLAQVSEWAASPTNDYYTPKNLERFSQRMLVEKTKEGGTSPHHEVFEQIEQFLAQPVSLEAPLMAHAIEMCRLELARVKREQLVLSFDDLLVNLSASLDRDHQHILAERIRTLYPVAMIDEFQDTDPLQYSIFHRIYGDHTQSGLLMIGDPKQAIYAFRGADIFTYIKARNQVASHFTLETNWRSSLDMVTTVNALFSFTRAPFMYEQDIPFFPVKANPKASKMGWVLDSVAQPALTYWWPKNQNEPMSKGDYEAIMATATASQIQILLTQSQTGQTYLYKGDTHAAIEPGNIAVLVRTGKEGHLIKQALARQGIASVYLSNRESVFNTSIAVDIQRVLTAVLNPDNERSILSCLASELFGLELSYLDQLNDDEGLWELVLAEFREYRVLWSERGVQSMLRSVMQKRHLAERWINDMDGERTLTDYLHLSELLQQASNDVESEHGLLHWYAQAMINAQEGYASSDEHIQRLESEQHLVQIVTIHKSKGLEYDLVFLPFVMSYREAQESKYYDTEQDKTVLDVMNQAASKEKADKERLAEDLRLLYVALTRAVYGVYVGVAPLRQGRSTKGPTSAHLSALGYLLQHGIEGEAVHLLQALHQLTALSDSMTVQPPPEPHDTIYEALLPTGASVRAQIMQQHIDRAWRITSYSNLVKHRGARMDAELEISGFDIDSAGDENALDELDSEKTIFNFPRGARPGTFLHSLFEQVEFTRPANDIDNTRMITELMDNALVEREWLPVLQQLVDTVLRTPLDGKKLCLSDKGGQQRLAEMEFLLPIETLHATALNKLICRHDKLSAHADALGFSQVKGMLKGFIDLVFEHQGKFYVLDWKSNHLGNDVSCYRGPDLNQAMIEHRYDLQYQLYSLALHRFLATRVPEYDYERHFGGVYYLFLRGIDGQPGNGIFYARPSAAFITELEHLIDGESLINRCSEQGQWELDI